MVSFAGALAEPGLRKGDTVLLLLPAAPQTVIAMLACARSGLINSVVIASTTPDRPSSSRRRAGSTDLGPSATARGRGRARPIAPRAVGVRGVAAPRHRGCGTCGVPEPALRR
ncbi:AMP-binding protein [Saccharothrix saharensis]|uniref:AMP-binding protein n=1 Tax=Saccharothrix saharensis TaxID=571190 RepID=UPI00115314AC